MIMAKCIMVQGTMSGAGKSLITAALCRIFKQDGFRTAPFKSQNMALNSFVTADGLEMGRAQAVQALAAGKEPDVRMNPILLKPTGEKKSQVIAGGRVMGEYSASDYYNMKKQLVPHILKAYEELAAENDIIVVEGAGSPAEINLRAGDIVNMGLAELIDAKVLLVGNIDPGGVFARLYGTVGLLSEAERKRVRGFIVNKFRGDKDLLKPGLAELASLTGIPVLGVVPYTDARIEEEDSLSAGLGRKCHEKLIDIAVIRLPFISNYTDFDPFDRSRHLGVRYVDEAGLLGRPDLIVIPGSKNTIEDLRWLKRKGLFKAILAAGKNGSDILGICGGYQMLGKRLWEPESGDSEEGFSFFPQSTEFRPGKLTRQVKGRFAAGPFKGLCVHGYEIHSGVTAYCGDGGPEGGESLLELETKKGERFADGYIEGNVCGTYLHGIFESGELLERLGGYYLDKRGLLFEEAGSFVDFNAYRQEQYDILAGIVRESVDIKKIYEAVG